MHENRAELFRNFETYVGRLPFRQCGNTKWLKLCEYPFYARSEDLAAMAHRLESEMMGEMATLDRSSSMPSHLQEQERLPV